MWQAGCCLVAMVTGRRPWRAMYPDCKDRRPDVRAYIQHYQREMVNINLYNYINYLTNV